ncbi:ATP-binding protein [Paratractidigestivibacter sp.]|uniref:ATP-binding protein n=1 Tax=Paratractidigestivibacter sp. TaxID=2847316 RepID=UPI002ABDD068|nr:ATP-binding protein [Paratractidigestivibacter sp.]
MTFNNYVTAAYSVAKLVLAAWLFSRRLPHRDNYGQRAGAVLIAFAGLAAACIYLGFSVYPDLTSDLSLVTAVLTFVGELALVTLAHRLVYECPIWTSVFCCSMAYSLENLSTAAHRTVTELWPPSSFPPPFLEESLKYWLVAAVVYGLAYLLLVKRVEKDGLLQIDDPVMVLTAALTVSVNMVLDLAVKDSTVSERGLPSYDSHALTYIYLLLCVYVMYSVFEIVYNRKLQLSVAAIERLRATEARQYEMSRENIEAINRKAHDLRHQIRTLANGAQGVDSRVLDDLSHEVDVYDSVVKSGNDALDTILTEKSLYCDGKSITLGCIVDGAALDFMPAADLYSLFGNALDNAIEAVERLDNPELRSIGLTVKRVGDMVSIHVENYFDGNVQFGSEGLPLSRKGDSLNHGYGVRSMRMIVETAGGSLVTRAVDDVFHLSVLLPVPQSRTVAISASDF